VFGRDWFGQDPLLKEKATSGSIDHLRPGTLPFRSTARGWHYAYDATARLNACTRLY
jgi:hypothetical protein